ncbi:MAG: BsaWI family type II restriction enzyme [Candidatus Dadabacteria bacterium]|nr:BsaWI family type II restriction enzyme [Candidatus Dadabacteria bacterium]
MTKDWNDALEKEFKETIRKYFASRIDEHLEGARNYSEVGNKLGQILKDSDKDIVKIVTPRAVKKWASPETLPLWEKFLGNEQIVLELREIGKSIANSMRPLAGNNFAVWVSKVLNKSFEQQGIPLLSTTKGETKKKLNEVFKGGEKPDIDIVVARNNGDPVAIISAKTTFAERILQTISWHSYFDKIPEVKDVKLFVVTAWETFERDDANRKRVQQLDGVYVCNSEVNEFGNIKIFSKIIDDLRAL